jgi:hypothetical protein
MDVFSLSVLPTRWRYVCLSIGRYLRSYAETTGRFKTFQVLFNDLAGLTSFCHQLDWSIRPIMGKRSPGVAIMVRSDIRYFGKICLIQRARIIAAPGAIGKYDFLRSRTREKDDSYNMHLPPILSDLHNVGQTSLSSKLLFPG